MSGAASPVAGPFRGQRIETGTCLGEPVALDVAVDGPDTSVAGTIVLIEGLGMQRTEWPVRLLAGLHDAGYRTVAFDNRDVGHSTVVPGLIEDLPRGPDGWPQPPYGLEDMAADVAGALDTLEIPEAHVVGRSMGGMIAQHLAMAFPDRVTSLVSLMSTTGARDVGRVHESARWVLTTVPPVDDFEAFLGYELARVEAIGSPGHVDHEVARARAEAAWERGVHPQGTARQLLAVRADGDRTTRLSEISAPTLVLHGDRDPLIDVSGGKATARAIAGARFEAIEGMGHDLPDRFVDEALLPLILAHVHN